MEIEVRLSISHSEESVVTALAELFSHDLVNVQHFDTFVDAVAPDKRGLIDKFSDTVGELSFAAEGCDREADAVRVQFLGGGSDAQSFAHLCDFLAAILPAATVTAEVLDEMGELLEDIRIGGDAEGGVSKGDLLYEGEGLTVTNVSDEPYERLAYNIDGQTLYFDDGDRVDRQGRPVFSDELESVSSFLDEAAREPRLIENRELARIAIRARSHNILAVPEDRRDDDLWREAMNCDLRVLDEVPRHLLTTGRCDAALAEYPWLVSELPPDLLTEEQVLAAIEDYPEAFEKLDDSLKTQAVCDVALEEQHANIEHMPEAWLAAAGEHVYLELVEFDPEIIERFTDRQKTPAVVAAAIEADGGTLEFVPDDMKTLDLCRRALETARQRDWAAAAVPERFRAELGLD